MVPMPALCCCVRRSPPRRVIPTLKFAMLRAASDLALNLKAVDLSCITYISLTNLQLRLKRLRYPMRPNRVVATSVSMQ